ncbi:MAG: transporter substrate-binding domain-containing protein [Colwellia sp.]|nr:transporter substrate-binding domain-containing protein [Colwellia sp.]
MLSNILKLFTFFLLISSLPAHAACKSTLTLGLGNIWPPYYFKEEQVIRGIDIDIVKFIFSQANICLRYKQMPSSSRALIELKKGNIDFLYAATFTQDRNEYAMFTKAYRHENVRIFWSEQQPSKLRETDLTGLLSFGLKGVTNRGSYIGENVKSLMAVNNSLSLISVPTIEQRMKMLALKRVDFTIEDEVAGLYFVNEHQLKAITRHPYKLFNADVSLMFSRTSISKEMVEGINVIIEQNHQEFINIRKGYLASK